MAAEGGDGNTFATWLESPAMTEPHRALSLARMARPCALLALAPLLAGCVAAVAVPAMTAAGVLSQKKRANVAAPPIQPPAAEPSVAAIEVPEIEGASEGVQLTSLTELPAPSGPRVAPEAAPWRMFAAFTLEQANALAAGGEVRSALLAPGSAAGLQARKQPCADREPAVIVDLDRGADAFIPDAAARAPADVTAALAGLREAGVVVLWISRLPADEVDRVAEALKSSGLDPTGRDPILLVRNEDERKQVLREQANETTCVIAIAGDRRADFDELFDYLRDPNQATMYDSLLNSGWFMVPPLFAAPPPIEVPDVSTAPPAGEDGGR